MLYVFSFSFAYAAGSGRLVGTLPEKEKRPSQAKSTRDIKETWPAHAWLKDTATAYQDDSRSKLSTRIDACGEEPSLSARHPLGQKGVEAGIDTALNQPRQHAQHTNIHPAALGSHWMKEAHNAADGCGQADNIFGTESFGQ